MISLFFILHACKGNITKVLNIETLNSNTELKSNIVKLSKEISDETTLLKLISKIYGQDVSIDFIRKTLNRYNKQSQRSIQKNATFNDNKIFSSEIWENYQKELSDRKYTGRTFQRGSDIEFKLIELATTNPSLKDKELAALYLETYGVFLHYSEVRSVTASNLLTIDKRLDLLLNKYLQNEIPNDQYKNILQKILPNDIYPEKEIITNILNIAVLFPTAPSDAIAYYINATLNQKLDRSLIDLILLDKNYLRPSRRLDRLQKLAPSIKDTYLQRFSDIDLDHIAKDAVPTPSEIEIIQNSLSEFRSIPINENNIKILVTKLSRKKILTSPSRILRLLRP